MTTPGAVLLRPNRDHRQAGVEGPSHPASLGSPSCLQLAARGVLRCRPRRIRFVVRQIGSRVYILPSAVPKASATAAAGIGMVLLYGLLATSGEEDTVPLRATGKVCHVDFSKCWVPDEARSR